MPNPYDDFLKEFEQVEIEQRLSGVKKYTAADLDEFEAELKAMEEEELAGVEFEQVNEQAVKEMLGQNQKIHVESSAEIDMNEIINKAKSINPDESLKDKIISGLKSELE